MSTSPRDLNAVAQRARRRIAIRLLPMVFVMYVVCYVDRANVSFAALRMRADLHMSARAYGFGVGIFFLGYILFEIPGAIIVERWSARKWMARIMITWGLLTILIGFVRTAQQFYIVRVLVGLSEASFFPGIIVYLTHWFRARDRARAIGFFYTGVPAAAVAGSLIASVLIEIHWFGIPGWRWLFIMEGVPPIILGGVALFCLTDWPREARWLPADERDWITATLDAETRAKKLARDYTIWQSLRDRNVILMACGWFFFLVGTLGSTYWAPIFIKRLSGLPDSKVALLGVLPGLAGMCGTLLNGWLSDTSGERRWHSAVPLFVGGMLFLALLTPNIPFPLAMACIALGLGLFFSFQPVFWSIPTMILCESAAAACFGLINSVGQIGGFVGPYAVGYLIDRSGNHTTAFAFIAACVLVAGCVVSSLKVANPASNFSSHRMLDEPLLNRS